MKMPTARFTRRNILQLLPPALVAPALPALAQNGSSHSMPAEPLDLDPQRIAAALSAMVDDGRTAGASVLIWKDGREAYFGSAGFADREGGRKMSRDTIAQIYSMTKPVTGVALMQLWEQGKFGLDDPLYRYLPEFEAIKVYAGKDSAGAPIYRAPARPIAVRDIMRHTAGFAYGPGDTPAHDAYVKADPMSLNIDLVEMGHRLAKVPLLFDPGARWRSRARTSHRGARHHAPHRRLRLWAGRHARARCLRESRSHVAEYRLGIGFHV